MKKYILIILVLLSYKVNSQTLSIFDIDTTNFPIMIAKFYAFDKDGNQITKINPTDFDLKEDGINRKVLNVSCPIPEPLQNVSMAMSIDVSGSMGYSNFGDIPVELGKTTAKELCNLVVMPPSEFALQTCHHQAFIIQDFTTNKSKALSAIATITAHGDNDFVEHLLSRLTGLLNIAKTGKYKRVAVLYTDAWWYALKPEELKQCKDTCMKYEIDFYAVIYSRPEAEPNGIKKSLQELANFTGGYLFDGVTSEQAAKEIGLRLQQFSQGGVPCEIEWESRIDCINRKTNVVMNYKILDLFDSIEYSFSKKLVKQLILSPTKIQFINPEIGKQSEQKVLLTAINGDFEVSNMTISNNQFDISPKQFELKENENIELRILYNSIDSGFNFCHVNVMTTSCPFLFNITAGFSGIAAKQTTLEITSPKLMDKYAIGNDTIIKWEGISASDTVQLDYSSNNGETWKVLDKYATGLSYEWKNIQKPSTKTYKIRAIQKSILNKSNLGACDITLQGHKSDVELVTTSPDGSMICSSAKDTTAIVWDVANGFKLFTLIGHKAGITNVDWSPDGKYIGTSSYDGTAIIWDPKSGKIIKKLIGHGTFVLSIKWSPDGKLIGTVGSDKRVIIWDSFTWNTVDTLTANHELFKILWTPDSRNLITNTYSGFFIWNLQNNKVTQLNNINKINYFQISHDGNKIAAASDKTINMWDLNNFNLIYSLTEHNNIINYISWSPDDSKLLSVGKDKICILWDVLTGKSIFFYYGEHKNEVNVAEWSPDGKTFASGCKDGKCVLWDAISGDKVSNLNFHDKGINCIAWINKNLLVTGSSDVSCIIWDAKIAKPITFLGGHADRIKNIDWNHQNDLIASLGRDKNCIIWKPDIGKIIQILKGQKGFIDLKWKPDGSQLVTLDYDQNVFFWDVVSGNKIDSLFDSTITMNHRLDWSPNHKYFAITGSGVVNIWDASSKKLFKSLIVYNTTCIPKWSPDSKLIATSNERTGCTIWDVATGDSIYSSIELLSNSGNSITWSPIGDRLAFKGKNNSIDIWSLDSNKLILKLSGHNEYIGNLVWSPDGLYIASSDSKKIIIWNSFTGEIVLNLNAHKDYITHISWNRDGSLLASSSEDETCKIWDIISGTQLYEFNDFKSTVYQVVWNNLSTKIATYSNELGIKIWNVDYVKSNIQEDESDIFSIVEPIVNSFDINLKECLVNSSKDSLVQNFVLNSGSWKFRVDSIYFRGIDASAFSLVSGLPKYELNEKEGKNTEFRFSPKLAKKYQAEIVILTQADSLIQKISGEGVKPIFAVFSGWLDFGKVPLKYSKTISDTILLTNISQKEIKIDSIGNIGPDATQFIILDDTQAFTLQSNESKKLNIKFEPKEVGRTSGQVAFFYNNFSSPAIVQLFGEGIDIKPKLNSNNPVCEGEKIMLFVDSIDGAKFFWTGPNNYKSTDQNPIIDDANSSHIGSYSCSVIYDIYSSDSSNIDVMVGKFDVSPGDSSLIFLGSAERRGISIQLTYPRVFDAGSIWLKNKFSVLNDFSTSFQFITGNGNNNGMNDGSIPGADGFALVFQNNNYPMEGSRSGSIGYTGITKSLVIEIDLFKNDWDENGNHVAVQSLKTEGNQPYHNNSTACLGISKNILEIKHGKYYFCKVDYILDEKELSIYIDSTGKFDEVSLIVPNIDFSEYLQLNGNDNVFIGITSATGNAYQNHSILNWRFPCKNIILSQNEGTRIIPLKNELMIYPNPTSNNLNIIYSLNKQSDIQFKIINNLGIEMITEEIIKNQEIGQYNYQINIDKLPQGIYHIVLKTDTEQLTEMFFKID